MTNGGGDDERDNVEDTTVLISSTTPPGLVAMAEITSDEGVLSGLIQSHTDTTTPARRRRSRNGARSLSPDPEQVREGSPRSSEITSSPTPRAAKRPFRVCKFETGMAQARRRVPYSLGPEKLAPDTTQATKSLDVETNDTLTAGMRKLYNRLLPSKESEIRRQNFVNKLENLLRSRWPDTTIKVKVFGSSGNLLGSSESDVDVSIATDCKEIENVCLIAELLEQNGMERIVCVSGAKIPIVKAWDPEHQVACDMNVNNPIALENTDLIRSYVSIDARVRPLAMVVKYWAKRRMLNDAALGGTLSSYTWICMVLNFLQTRTPPILPSLQKAPSVKPKILKGVNISFDKNLKAYEGFGSDNDSTLGCLLFDFFRYFGHELDFEENALSVRLGEVIPKSQKAWHLLQDNRLCVEEPFNTARNLANTADDTSMRGIHLELRRAFKLLSEGELEKCCEEFVPAPEEFRQTAVFIHPTARPLIPQAPAQTAPLNSRSIRNSYRNNRSQRSSGSRRSSNSTARNPNYLHDMPFQMTTQELQLQAQHQQHLLHDQLFQQYQYLQLQEQELRMQLYQQNYRQRSIAALQGHHQSALNHDGPMQMPVSPTVYNSRLGNMSPFMGSALSSGTVTNPTSPLLGHAVPDNRRFARRTSLATSVPTGALRAHSQPARSVAPSTAAQLGRGAYGQFGNQVSQALRRPSFASQGQSNTRPPMTYRSESGTLYDIGKKPVEFVGYYVGNSPYLASQTQSTTVSPFLAHSGLAIQNGGLSPTEAEQMSRTSSRMSTSSQGQEPHLSHNPRLLNGSSVGRRWSAAVHGGQTINLPKPSFYTPQLNSRPTGNIATSTSASDDLGIDTPPSPSEDQFQESVKEFPLHTNGYHLPRKAVSRLPERFKAVPKDRAQNGDSSASHPDNRQMMTTSPREAIPDQFLSQSVDVLPPDSDLRSDANGVGKRKNKRAEKPMAPNGTVVQHPVIQNGAPGSYAHPAADNKLPEVSNGWQTQKKKKNKGRKPNKSESDIISGLNSAGGERLPADEALRKGG